MCTPIDQKENEESMSELSQKLRNEVKLSLVDH